jgi:hypothetical protein
VSSTRASIAASLKALLVVAGGLVVRVDNRVGGDSLSIPRLGPGVDGINIAKLIVPVNAISVDGEHGALEGRELTNVLEPEEKTNRCQATAERDKVLAFKIGIQSMRGYLLARKQTRKRVQTTCSHIATNLICNCTRNSNRLRPKKESTFKIVEDMLGTMAFTEAGLNTFTLSTT